MKTILSKYTENISQLSRFRFSIKSQFLNRKQDRFNSMMMKMEVFVLRDREGIVENDRLVCEVMLEEDNDRFLWFDRISTEK